MTCGLQAAGEKEVVTASSGTLKVEGRSSEIARVQELWLWLLMLL